MVQVYEHEQKKQRETDQLRAKEAQVQQQEQRLRQVSHAILVFCTAETESASCGSAFCELLQTHVVQLIGPHPIVS